MQEEKTLEQLRDEKCIPVTQNIIDEMGKGLINTKDNYNELVLKSLSIMLASDLNIATEVSYVPQAILKVLAGLNTTFQSCDVIMEDDERYGSIASKILQIVSVSNINTNATPEEMIKEFEPVKAKLNELFTSEKLTKLELVYIKDMIFDSFTSFNNILSNSIAMATEKAECKVLGIESMTDLSLRRLDEYLKS